MRMTKNNLLVILMAAFFAGMFVLCLIKQPKLYSTNERRMLQQYPRISKSTLLDGTWMKAFEEASMDQFPFREEMRKVKAYTSLNVLGQKDNNGMYLWEGYAGKVEYPLKEESVYYAAERFQWIYNRYLKDTCENVYYSIIPDKNYYLADKSGHLSMDYDRLVEIMKKQLGVMEYIDIFPYLSIEDYYKTDTHWRQECLVDVAMALGRGMDVQLEARYEICRLKEPFYGVYYGQAALPMEEDGICYLTNDVVKNCRVYDYENERQIAIYDMEKAMGEDPYEMFLSGALSLLTIENPKAEKERELLVFRDSFGSSLVPLLTEGYSKITVIDIRYMESELLDRFIDFENQDVIFLYSTLVLNNSETIK